MPTIQEEKPAKPRSRSRKADQRSSKANRKQAEVRAEADAASAMVAEPLAEQPLAEQPPVEQPLAVETETVAVEAPPALPAEPAVAIEPMVAMERLEEAALVGEVLPPEVVRPASEVDGFQAIAQAYGEYTKKSWLNGRFLMERLIAVRSFEEAIEVQSEFAKQAYANFLTQSGKLCVLYGEWAQQFFRPPVVRF